MGDPHFGMYAWGAEAGDDFDLGIAKRLTYAAIDSLVESAPPAKEALIIELGDFFHADGDEARTQSGHALDTDTRHARVLRLGFDAMCYVVRATLRKHEHVTLRIVSGNHDSKSSVALRLMLVAYFHSEPRVTVDESPAMHWYYKFNRVLIGATHGDKSRPRDMGTIMAADRPREWGQTDFRYFYHGHFHSKQKDQEHPGCVVEGFRTLAPKDAWHAGQRYRSGREMQCIIHHRKYGEIERHTWPVAMVKSKRSAPSSRNTRRQASKSAGSAGRR